MGSLRQGLGNTHHSPQGGAPIKSLANAPPPPSLPKPPGSGHLPPTAQPSHPLPKPPGRGGTSWGSGEITHASNVLGRVAGPEFWFSLPVGCCCCRCTKTDRHSTCMKRASAFSLELVPGGTSTSLSSFLPSRPHNYPDLGVVSSIQFIDRVLSEVEGGSQTPAADLLAILTASAVSGPLSPALVCPRREIFRCPTCPATNAQEETGNLQAVSQLSPRA